MSQVEEQTDIVSVIKTAVTKHDSLRGVLDYIKDQYLDTPKAAGERLPVPVTITSEQLTALSQFQSKYGSVIPTERRTLTADEVDEVMAERMLLDEVKKMIEVRTESIRTTIFNHLDVEAEQGGTTEAAWGVDDKGHYVLPGEVVTPLGKKFTREVRTTSPTLNASALKDLVEQGELDNTTYLSLTTQTRVVDENKVMLALKKDPALVEVISKALDRGKKSSSFNVRKA